MRGSRRMAGAGLFRRGSRLGSAGGEVAVLAPDQIFGANLYQWLRADMGITLTSGRVSTWADQSGNARDVTQGTAANRPVTATALGQTSIQFSAATSEFLRGATVTLAQPFTVLDVIFTLSVTGAQAWGPEDAGGAGRIFTRTNGTDFQMFGGLTLTSTGIVAAINTGYSTTCVFNGASSEGYVNNTLRISGNAGANPLGRLAVGRENGGFYTGHLLEHVVVNAAVTAGQRTQWAAYVADRYGL